MNKKFDKIYLRSKTFTNTFIKSSKKIKKKRRIKTERPVFQFFLVV